LALQLLVSISSEPLLTVNGTMEKTIMKRDSKTYFFVPSLFAASSILMLFGTSGFAGDTSQQKSESKAEQKTESKVEKADQKPGSKSDQYEEKGGSKAEKASQKAYQKGASSVTTLQSARHLFGDQKSNQKGLLMNR
jgi:hypothetical protein